MIKQGRRWERWKELSEVSIGNHFDFLDHFLSVFWLKSGIITRQASKTWLVYLGDVPALPLPVVVQVHHVQVRTSRGAPRWLPLKIVIFQMLPPIQHIWLFSPLFLISFLFHVCTLEAQQMEIAIGEKCFKLKPGTVRNFQMHLILGIHNACAIPRH